MNIMSTGQTHVADEIVRFPLNTLFDSIDQQMRSLDMDAIIAAAELPVKHDRIARLILIHDAVRPVQADAKWSVLRESRERDADTMREERRSFGHRSGRRSMCRRSRRHSLPREP